jgi:hypothetical protein
VVVLSDPLANVEAVLSSFAQFADVDDVFSGAFKGTIVVQSMVQANDQAEDRADHQADLGAQLRSSNMFQSVYFSTVTFEYNILPSGPYFLRGWNIHQAWRLYPDELDAFIFAVIPEDVRNPQRYVPSLVLPTLLIRNAWAKIHSLRIVRPGWYLEKYRSPKSTVFKAFEEPAARGSAGQRERHIQTGRG